LTTLPFHVEED